MAEPTRVKAPVRVGFYDIAKTLGKGNYAVVKLAKHRITKTEVRKFCLKSMVGVLTAFAELKSDRVSKLRKVEN